MKKNTKVNRLCCSCFKALLDITAFATKFLTKKLDKLSNIDLSYL